MHNRLAVFAVLICLTLPTLSLGSTKNAMTNGYFDQCSLLHMEKGVKTENGILFLAYWIKLRKLNNRLTSSDLERVKTALNCTTWKNKGKVWYQANPFQQGQHFSRDNMWGLYYLWDLVGRDVDYLPIYGWNGEYWAHPNGWSMFLYKRGHFYLWPLLQSMKSYSDITQKDGETSGDLLWWLMWEDEKTNQLNDFIFYVTFGHRRSNWDHPIITEAQLLWNQ